MKRLLLLAILLIGFTTITNAQDVKFGVKGGVNFSTLSGNDANLSEGRTGFHIGLVGELGLTDKFSIQPEILYSSQGADIKNFDLDTKIDYLNVPILAKYKFLNLLNIYGGPQFGIQVNEGDDLSESDLNSFDLSAAIGAGVEFRSFFGQIRYNYSFTDIIDNQDTKNSVFQISVGYYIF